MTLTFEARLSRIQILGSKYHVKYDIYWIDLDPMTLILKLDLNTTKMYLYTEVKFLL